LAKSFGGIVGEALDQSFSDKGDFMRRSLRCQSLRLFLCELKHEVFREAFSVPPNSFVQSQCWHFVQLSQVSIEHHLLIAYEVKFGTQSTRPGQEAGARRMFSLLA